jgi:hypothetical protein
MLGCPEATRETPPGSSRKGDEAGKTVPSALATPDEPPPPAPSSKPTMLVPNAHALALTACGDALYYATVAVPTDPLRGLLKRNGAIMKLPKAGGEAMILVGGLAMVEQLACSASTLYASAWFGTGAKMAPSATPKVPIQTDMFAVSLAAGPGAAGVLRNITSTIAGKRFAVDQENVFFAAEDSISMAPLKGGKTVTLAKVEGITTVTVDDAFVFATSEDPDAIWKAPKAGGEAIELATEQMGPHSIVADADTVYWTNIEGGEVLRLAKTGGSPTKVAYDLANPGDLLLDGDLLYIAVEGEEGEHRGAIVKCPRRGCAHRAIPVALGIKPAQRLAVDATSVYWTNEDGELLKAPK